MINDDKMPVIASLDYRGEHVDFYDDDYGQCVVAKWHDQEIGMGTYNLDYEQDMRDLIDEHLDTIWYDGEGGKLSWFCNGYSGYRDIKLEFRSRMIRIWLVDNPDVIDKEKIIKEAEIELAKWHK